MNALGHIEELGMSVSNVRQALSKWFINVAVNPAFNPYLVGNYKFPVILSSTNHWYQDWPAALLGFLPTFGTGCGPTTPIRGTTTWDECDASDAQNGYPQIARGAISYTVGVSDGPYTGQAAWNWINATARGVSTQSTLNDNPKWAVLPRSQAAERNRCDLNNDGIVDITDLIFAILQAIGSAPCKNADLFGNGTCNIVDVQRVAIAALGGDCKLGR